jgi:hypothetical protein
MEYVKAYSRPPRGPLALEEGVTRESVALECRDAALAFVAGAARWDKLDLVLWLTGPYAGATRHVSRGERVAGLDEERDVDDEAVEELVRRARLDVVGSLAEAAEGDGILDFVEACVERALVRRAEGADGLEVWVPVDGSRVRLRDRVWSLFAADYLNDAIAYEQELFVCPKCESVVFDEGSRRLGLCAAHKRVSGVVPREDGTIPKVAGED